MPQLQNQIQTKLLPFDDLQMAYNGGHREPRSDNHTKSTQVFCLDIFFRSQNQARVIQCFASHVWTIASSFPVNIKQQAQGGHAGRPRCCSSRHVSAPQGPGRSFRSADVQTAAMGKITCRKANTVPRRTPSGHFPQRDKRGPVSHKAGDSQKLQGNYVLFATAAVIGHPQPHQRGAGTGPQRPRQPHPPRRRVGSGASAATEHAHAARACALRRRRSF